MAGQTKGVRSIGQQFQVVSLMGPVAGTALAVSKRFMGNLELLFHFFMAGETGL